MKVKGNEKKNDIPKCMCSMQTTHSYHAHAHVADLWYQQCRRAQIIVYIDPHFSTNPVCNILIP